MAQELRSQGRELAEGIRAEADKDRTVIIARAYENAEILRGEGDAAAAQIYATAYNQARDFYDFYRSLFAYREVFRQSNSFLILEPDSDFFQYIGSSQNTNQ